ncbi:hypothetical protein SLE2022_180160 [Rubroshorea leprosula]
MTSDLDSGAAASRLSLSKINLICKVNLFLRRYQENAVITDRRTNLIVRFSRITTSSSSFISCWNLKISDFIGGAGEGDSDSLHLIGDSELLSQKENRSAFSGCLELIIPVIIAKHA